MTLALLAEYIKGIITLWPILVKILALFIQTPAEKREELVTKFHAAFKKAEDTKGDTSDLENLISRGK